MGEILDRAVTIFVRNAWLFIALAAILYVPTALAQLSMGSFWTWYMAQISGTMAGNTKPDFPAEVFARAGGMQIAILLLVLVISPLIQAAGLFAAGKLLRGEPAALGESLRFALMRWGRVLVFILLWVIVGIALMFGLILALTFFTVVLAALHQIALSVIGGLFALLLFILFGMTAAVSAGVGFATAIAEDVGPFTAFRLGLERTVNRSYFWRSMLLALIWFAIALGFSMVSGLGAILLMEALHSPLPMIALSAVTGLLQFGFFVTLLATYYYDLRVRREGVDLSLLAERLGPTPLQTP